MPNDPIPPVVSVAIGRWAVAAPPSQLRTLLGSCVGVALHDRAARVAGLAHVVLPDSRGDLEHPGKYADTAIPALIADIERTTRLRSTGRLVAKLAGGARMFQLSPESSRNIGRLNQDAVETLLAAMRIPVVGRDLGGDGGRNMILDPATGRVWIRSPGGEAREI